MNTLSKIDQLIHKGVKIPDAGAVEIGDEINVDRISGRGVTLFSGTKLFGRHTLICDEVRIGYEGPATVADCYIGPQVDLKGGFFQEAAFLAGSSCGLGSHVRQGTILEESASIAHTVGLKQTILFPFVTLGSLINFCDCLMAGGTSRNNHSEVGSSYIHFNFTPHQDKATPSLMGDVPRGVMLNQPPIFLGGQGGLVGPCRLAYGTVVAAGCICRKDQFKENYLVMESGPRTAQIPYRTGGYRNLKRILHHNYNYVANLVALLHWYKNIRDQFVGADFPLPLAEGLSVTLEKGICERIRQMEKLKEKIEGASLASQDGLEARFCLKWHLIKSVFNQYASAHGDVLLKNQFREIIAKEIARSGKDYLKVITTLDDHQASVGSQWLQSIVDQLLSLVQAQ